MPLGKARTGTHLTRDLLRISRVISSEDASSFLPSVSLRTVTSSRITCSIGEHLDIRLKSGVRAACMGRHVPHKT